MLKRTIFLILALIGSSIANQITAMEADNFAEVAAAADDVTTVIDKERLQGYQPPRARKLEKQLRSMLPPGIKNDKMLKQVANFLKNGPSSLLFDLKKIKSAEDLDAYVGETTAFIRTITTGRKSALANALRALAIQLTQTQASLKQILIHNEENDTAVAQVLDIEEALPADVPHDAVFLDNLNAFFQRNSHPGYKLLIIAVVISGTWYFAPLALAPIVTGTTGGTIIPASIAYFEGHTLGDGIAETIDGAFNGTLQAGVREIGYALAGGPDPLTCAIPAPVFTPAHIGNEALVGGIVGASNAIVEHGLSPKKITSGALTGGAKQAVMGGIVSPSLGAIRKTDQVQALESTTRAAAIAVKDLALGEREAGELAVVASVPVLKKSAGIAAAIRETAPARHAWLSTVKAGVGEKMAKAWSYISGADAEAEQNSYVQEVMAGLDSIASLANKKLVGDGMPKHLITVTNNPAFKNAVERLNDLGWHKLWQAWTAKPSVTRTNFSRIVFIHTKTKKLPPLLKTIHNKIKKEPFYDDLGRIA